MTFNTTMLLNDDSEHYDIAFYGDLHNDCDQNQAKLDLQSLFRLSDETVRILFDADRTVMKRGIDYDTANVYLHKLYEKGIDVALEPTSDTAPDTTAVDTVPLLTSKIVDTPPPKANGGLKLSLDALDEALFKQPSKAVDHTTAPAPTELKSESVIEPALEIGAVQSETPVVANTRKTQADNIVSLPTKKTDDLADIIDAPLSAPTRPKRNKYRLPQYDVFSLSVRSGEYWWHFWLNALLTIVSAGLMRPHADISRRHLLYHHTKTIMGDQFYYKQPTETLSLLYAYLPLIAAAGFSAAIAVIVSLKWAVCFFITGSLLALPYFIIKSRAYHLQATEFKGHRFDFAAQYGDALKCLIIWPLLGVISCGALLPRALMNAHRFFIVHTYYADKAFDYNGKEEDYYLAGFGMAILGAGLVLSFQIQVPELRLFVALSFIGLLWVWSVTLLTNLYYRQATWQGFEFSAKYRIRSYGLMMISCAMMTVFSIGILLPNARLQMMRYKAMHTSIIR